MAASLIHDASAWSYGIAAVALVAFTLRLLLTWRGGRRAWLLLVASLASAAWAAWTLATIALAAPAPWLAARVFDALRLAAWFAFLWTLLEDQAGPRLAPRGQRSFFALPAVLLGLGTLLPHAAPPLPESPPAGAIASFAALLGAAVCGLVIVEQLYRRTPQNRRWAVKPLVIGLGGMFAFDIAMYADAMLFRQLDAAMWAARGLSLVPVMVLVAIATARNGAWTIDLHVSRGVVLHSTAVLATGAYLLIVAAAAYWARFFGGAWGEILAVAFVFAALLALAVIGFSGRMRAALKVFVNKHFFSYRYDWRREWLQFTQMLGTAAHKQKLYEQVLQALANLVESVGGALWLQADGALRQVAAVNFPRLNATPAEIAPLAAFLRRSGWVVRLDELARLPGRYPGLAAPAWLAPSTQAWLVVPLANGAELIGFAVLTRPRTALDVNWEVLDLLKTASRQAASFLAQLQANEALLEAEKFGAFNRMSAFVVHDLKNLVAQLALLLKNDERHRGNPEFQRDMVATVEHVLGRMQRLMLQLRDGTTPAARPGPVELRPLVERVAGLHGDPRVSLETRPAPGLRIVAHEERLERVLRHMVQNALEAVDDAGHVRLRSYRDGAQAVVEVIDDGVGMSEQFVRERLFRPFQSTKPQGTGIGMNESFHYLQAIGGSIAAESEPGRGTTFRVRLALAATAEPAVATLGLGA